MRRTRKRGRRRVWKSTETFSLRVIHSITAITLSPTMTVPIAIVHRGPQTSPIQPIIGAPSGVPPMKIAM